MFEKMNEDQQLVIFAALASMVADIHAPQDLLTANQWAEAESMWQRIESLMNEKNSIRAQSVLDPDG